MIQTFFLEEKILLLLLCLSFVMLLFSGTYDLDDLRVYAHLFTRDETGTFVSIVDQVQTELNLIVTNLENNNVTLAQNHAAKAGSLIPRVIGEIAEDNPRLASDLMRAVFGMENMSTTSTNREQATTKLVSDLNEKLDEAKIIRIAQVQPSSNPLDEITNFLGGIFGGNSGEPSGEQAQNARIEALAFADLIDSVLINYGKAYNVGFDMTNMSNMVMTGARGFNSSSMVMNNTGNSNNSGAVNMNMDRKMNMNAHIMNTSSNTMAQQGGEINNDYQLVHIADYQSAQALAKKGLEFFNTDLRHMAINNKTIFVTKLKNGLLHLNDSIENKVSPMDIMMIVHSEIHPNLQEAFNLQLRK